MAPRTDWSVDLAVVLARIESMDPGGAAADAAEIGRIMNAAQRIAMTLLSRFDTIDGLAGDGAAAADRAGAQLGADVGAVADRLAPAQTALTAAAGDLAASAAVRPHLVNTYVGGGGTVLQAAVLRAAIAGTMNAVYSDPMSGRTDGLSVAETPGQRVGGPAAISGAAPTAPLAAPAPSPVSGPDPIPITGVAPVATSGAPAPGAPVQAPPARPAPTPPSPTRPPAPAGSSPPSPGPGPLAPGPAGSAPAGAVPARSRGTAAPTAAGVRPAVAFGIAGRTPPVPAAPTATSAAASAGAAAGRGVPAPATAGPAASATSAPGATQSGRPGASSTVPPGAGRSGAREDTERRRPDYLLSTQECARLIGPLPVAGPAVLGEMPAPEPAPEGPDSGGGSDDDEDVDFTL
ncbi:hypothetical protein [Gordonia caeni]|uniref:hypothetical protein n=1 Tax=Gordonia caeni TaxID=1007097 RepID=UPI0031D604B1